MRNFNKRTFCATLASVVLASSFAFAGSNGGPQPLSEGSQAIFSPSDDGQRPRIAFMPPATEFTYYAAVFAGIKSMLPELDVDVFMLAPQSGADINGQMGMIQDVITQGVQAIIVLSHDDAAAAPLIKRAIDQGIAVVIFNSDIPNFPTPVNAVVGYSQRNGTFKIGEYLVEAAAGKPMNIGIIEGQPGYHSTERVGGFLDAIKPHANLTVVASLVGRWNVEGGNTAAMDMLQSNPEIDAIFAANDGMAMGAALAAKALGRSDLLIFGNDGDTAAFEEIERGNITATVNTVPYLMGQTAIKVAADILSGETDGGFFEIPTQVVDSENVLAILRKPEEIFPAPSKSY